MRFAIIFLLALACASTAEVPLDTAFALKVGETTTIASTDLTVTLADVADSRCPHGVTCVWEGEARVTLRVNSDLFDVKVPGSVTARGYAIEVREVTQTKPYTATIVVRRTERG